MENETNVRYVVRATLLGQDMEVKKKGQEKEYAIEVTLSDESKYTMFRSLKDIALLQSRLISQFPIEAGYFKKSERLIPDCPVKQSVFGIQRLVRDDRTFEKLLNSYIKEIPGLPAAIVKCELISNFFILKASDISLPESKKPKEQNKKKKKLLSVTTEDSTISGPLSLRSYYAVADYKDKKSRLSISEGAVVQVMKKDPMGWWMVECGGTIGWAPASYLVPVDSADLQDEAEENAQLIEPEKVGARYIGISNYQASREDELSFVRGAIVKVINKYVDGWWLVRYNGGEGYVPGTLFKKFDKRQGTVYVKKIKRRFAHRMSTKIIPTIKPTWMEETLHNKPETKPNTDTKSSLAIYQCKAIFEGAPERFELTLNKNDTVKVLDRQDHGWWYVEDCHGQSGWVPASYLYPLLDRGKDRVAGKVNTIGSVYTVLKNHTADQEDELSVKKQDEVKVLMVSDDGWWSVMNTVTKAQGLIPSVYLVPNNETNGDGETESISVDITESTSPSDMNQLEQNEEYDSMDDLDALDSDLALDMSYISTSDFSKEAIDELDLFEGQVVCVIDNSDKDVWYVNCDGKEGWVPANILQEFTNDGSSTSGESTPSSNIRSRGNSVGISSDDSDVDGNPVQEPRKRVHRLSYQDVSTWEHHQKKSSDIKQRSYSTNYCLHNGDAMKQQSSTTNSCMPNGNEMKQESILDGENQTSSVTIMVEDKTLEELEREAAEAERRMLEASELAKQLKMKVAVARSLSSPGSNSPTH